MVDINSLRGLVRIKRDGAVQGRCIEIFVIRFIDAVLLA